LGIFGNNTHGWQNRRSSHLSETHTRYSKTENQAECNYNLEIHVGEGIKICLLLKTILSPFLKKYKRPYLDGRGWNEYSICKMRIN
jgi:hypothetical protein